MLDQDFQEFRKAETRKWVGDLPDGWRLIRNQGLFDETKTIGFADEELLSVTIERGIIPQTEITTKKDSSNEDKSKYKLLEPGDLAYNKMRMWQGAIGRSDHRGIVSPAYVVIRPRDPDYSRYFHYLYRTHRFITEANRNSYGLCDDMNSLRYEDFKTIHTPVPPKDTMYRIVSFLDEKTAEIDAAIAKKRRLIDLLNEQKAILINRAVTKGLNPDAPMKDSGVDWIGEIPAHWEVKKFKFLIDRLVGGSTPSMDNQRYWHGHIPWASPKDMRSEVICDTQLKITDAGRGANGLELVPSNSMIFVARSGVLKNRIPVALTGNDLTLNQDMKAVVPKTLTSEFMISLFNGLQSILLQKVTKIGATVDSVEIHDLMNFPIAYPPRKEEQEMIVRRADELSSSVGTTIASVEQEVSTLNEFKQTLIANAVTGKIKI